MVIIDLHDEFTKVGLDRLQAVPFEETRQLDLLAHHGLRLDHASRAAVAHDAQHRLAGGLPGRRPMHLRAGSPQALLHLRQVGVEVFDRVLLDLAGEAAKAVGIAELVEEEARALLVRRLRALVDGGAFVGRQARGELVDRLGHRGDRRISSGDHP